MKNKNYISSYLEVECVRSDSGIENIHTIILLNELAIKKLFHIKYIVVL